MSAGDDAVVAFLKEFGNVKLGRVEQFRLGRIIDQAIYDNEEVYFPSGGAVEEISLPLKIPHGCLADGSEMK